MLRTDIGRGPAAEVDGLYRGKLAFFRLAADIENEPLYVLADFWAIAVDGARGEIAIRAAMLAKRKMDIERFIGIVRHYSTHLMTSLRTGTRRSSAA